MRTGFLARLLGSAVLSTQRLSLAVALICSFSPAMAVESNTSPKSESSIATGPSYEKDMAQAYKAFDEKNYSLAKQSYEAILKTYPDDARAIIGLARTLHRIKNASGIEPPELHDVMEKVKKTVDTFARNNDDFRKSIYESLNESADMQGKKEALTEKLRNGGAAGLVRAGSDASPAKRVQSGFGFSSQTQAGQDARRRQEASIKRDREYYQRREQEWRGRALLFKRDCPEPMYKNWFFLEPPA